MQLAEIQTRHIVSAVHAAAGNEKGVAGAARIQFFEDPRQPIAHAADIAQVVAGVGQPLLDGEALARGEVVILNG